MKAIAEWYNSEDYEQGLELYKEHIGSDTLLKFLEKGENPFTRKKLKTALKSIIIDDDENPDPPVEKPKPTVEKKYSKEVIMLFKERAMFHEQLKHQTNDADRCKIAFRIRAICKRIELALNPQALPTPAELPKNPLELMKILNNNRPYISKYKNDPLKQGEVVRRQKENELIEVRLKSL